MNVEMAECLAKRRRAMGLSQEALAEKVGVSRQAVSKWERSESSPDTDNLIALAALYDVTLDELLFGEVEDDVEMDSDDVAGVDAAADVEADPRMDEPKERDGGEARTDATADAPSDSEDFRIGMDGIHVQSADNDYVHITWKDGVHVKDGKKGDEVHVGWDGIHINDDHYDGWQSAHDDWMSKGASWHGKAKPRRGSAWRIWNTFPFPLIALLGYLAIGFCFDAWLLGLLVFLAIPAYYALGGLIFGKRVCAFLCTLCTTGAIAAFIWFASIGYAHPAWLILIAAPIIDWLMSEISKAWNRSRKKSKGACTA